MPVMVKLQNPCQTFGLTDQQSLATQFLKNIGFPKSTFATKIMNGQMKTTALSQSDNSV